MQVDLHAHTNASDGTLSPSELVKRAKSVGLAGVAITDHDTTDGIAGATKAGETLGITVIPGIEINTEWQGKEVHVLGYYIDREDTSFQTLLHRLRDARHERLNTIIEKLTEAGMNITVEDVIEEAAGGAVGRPHVARVLVKKKYAEHLRDAFDKFLKRGCPGYVERYKLHPMEAVEAIRNARGSAVLAHPGLIGDDSLVTELIKVGLVGIETDHPDHAPEIRRKYREIAALHGLIATGGSDFHGAGGEHRGDLGSVTVSMDTTEQLWARRAFR